MAEILETAARKGDIDMLYDLIDKDRHLLDIIGKDLLVDTPLHIAAQHGQIPFAREIMMLNPSFAWKLNGKGHSVMHLALYSKKTDMVLEFLNLEPGLVRIRGRGGETPLHYLAKKGEDMEHQRQKIVLLGKFISACPLSIRDMTNQRETVFHIAVEHENFDAFDFLLGRLRRALHGTSEIHEREIINLKNGKGDNVLHIATEKNQLQVVTLLLKNSKIEVNAKNSRGVTALDICIENGYTDVRDGLLAAGAKSGESIPQVSISIPQVWSIVPFAEQIAIHFIRWKNNINNGLRNLLLGVAATVATVAFQAALSPPGGVWQDNANNRSTTGINSNVEVPHRAGTVIMGTANFLCFYIYNSIIVYITTMTMVFLLPEGKITKLLRGILFLYLFCYILSLGVIWPYSTGEPIFIISIVVMLLLYMLGVFGFGILRVLEVRFLEMNEQIQ
ncbi:ankyrin repeat-containing protein BDA1-like [Ziziphus jujuba]|uniref:Ankyrin repeat-containing protein BDA1-like n=1 Tax=Ziziphus jujuba TaxID=326968 RepID=A0ABM4A2W3_ZIZJJ|nr:ankyrin repeat-containing protein BDA1-like [Ziziphus jujuba]